MDSESSKFHFSSEIAKGKTYRLLFPDTRVGLAVIHLYEKIENGAFPDKFFKEIDIHDALLQVSSNNSSDSKHHPKEYFNGIVSDLQEYFLRYDEDRQQYSFKEYAYTFCAHAKQTLHSFFDPTQIEVICDNLREKLDNCDSISSLKNWFELEFSTFKPHLKNQLDYLDKQIDQSVVDLRENKKLNLQEGAIIETLRQIDERFEVIRGQNKELRVAFQAIDEIRRLLNKNLEKYDDDVIEGYTYDAVNFFQQIHRLLLLIDKRLDRIQPRIKQLFSNLNKPLFNVRIEKFVSYLIANAEFENAGSRKEVILPRGIPRPLTRLETPEWIIVERKTDLFPAKAKARFTATETPNLKAKAFSRPLTRIRQHDEVKAWIDNIKSDLDEKKQVDISDYFFRILHSHEDNALDTAILVVYTAIKFFGHQSKYSIHINPSNIQRVDTSNTQLWQMTIATV